MIPIKVRISSYVHMHMNKPIIQTYQHLIINLYIALEQPGGGGNLYPLSMFSKHYIYPDNRNACNAYAEHMETKASYSFTSLFVTFSNGLCPKLQISYSTQP